MIFYLQKLFGQVKVCADCVYAKPLTAKWRAASGDWQVGREELHCTNPHMRRIISGESSSCDAARHDHSLCGMRARYFERREG